MNEQQNTDKIETTTNYRAEVTFNDETFCSISGSTLQGVKDHLQNLLPGPKLRFRPISGGGEQDGTLGIYHDSAFNSAQPIGWLVGYEIPVNMSARVVTAARLGRRQAA